MCARRRRLVRQYQVRKKGYFGGFGRGGRGGDGESGVEIESDGRQADFGAAGLVAEFQRDVLSAQRSVGGRGDGKAKRDGVLIDVEGLLRKSEGMQLAFGVGDFAGFESCREVGAEVGSDEVILGFFAGVDMEAGTDFENDSNLKGAAAADGFEGNVGGGGNNFAAGGNLRLRGGQCGDDEQEHDGKKNRGGRLHSSTWVPSC